MGNVLFAVVVTLLALGTFACRLMPFEVGARILPKRLTRVLYGGTPRKKPAASGNPLSN
jgi:hypothetical protein